MLGAAAVVGLPFFAPLSPPPFLHLPAVLAGVLEGVRVVHGRPVAVAVAFAEAEAEPPPAAAIPHQVEEPPNESPIGLCATPAFCGTSTIPPWHNRGAKPGRMLLLLLQIVVRC